MRPGNAPTELNSGDSFACVPGVWPRRSSTNLGSASTLGFRALAHFTLVSLRLVESGSAVVERDVGGPNCVDVSNALALITAVTLDASPAATRTDFSVTVKQKSTKAFAIGPVAGIYKGVAPNVVPTLGLSLTYHARNRFGSPEFRIEGLFAESKWADVFDDRGFAGSSRFLWFASRMTACPLQLQVSFITVGPCALLEMGALEGQGRARLGDLSKDTGWLMIRRTQKNCWLRNESVRYSTNYF